MNTNSAEAAALRAQIASLRASVASFVEASERSIAELQRKVQRLDLESDSDGEFEDDANVSISRNERAFPSEIFVKIGEYLKPGSRTLLHLASTCSDLFNLLVPRLWMRLTSDNILGHGLTT